MSSTGAVAVTAPALRSTLTRLVLGARQAGRAAPPGAVLGVSAPAGRVTTAVGHRQVFDEAGPLPRPLPMTTGTLHDLGSVTKVMATTSAVLARVDRGELSLDAPLSSLLPGARTSPYAQVSCRELLLHRAGLWEWWPTYVTARSPAAAVAEVLALPPRYPRGTGRHYSDLGFMLLGAVVAGDRPLDAVVDELVLRPLALSSTTYGRPRGALVACGARGDTVERRMLAAGDPYPVPVETAAFDGWREGVRAGEVDDGNAFHAFGGVAGHAGLFSTAADVLRWGEAVLSALRGAGPWGRETVAQFLAPGPDDGQRLGFRSWRSGSGGCETEAFGHPGFPGAVTAVLPEHETCVVLLANRLHVPGPSSALEIGPVWQAVLDDVHAMLHDPRPQEDC